MAVSNGNAENVTEEDKFAFFLLFAEKVHLAIPFSASFPSVVCIKDGVVSHVNWTEKSNIS